jgi:hypothetical protein
VGLDGNVVRMTIWDSGEARYDFTTGRLER